MTQSNYSNTKMGEIVKEIGTERNRQVFEEGWTSDHDDGHHDDSLSMAAACYAAPEQLYRQQRGGGGECSFVDPWPWPINFRGNQVRDFTEANKDGKSRRRQLIIAAALIVAEIERLDRAEDSPK